MRQSAKPLLPFLLSAVVLMPFEAEAASIVGLKDPSLPSNYSFARSVSDDGSIVAGETNARVTRWTISSGDSTAVVLSDNASVWGTTDLSADGSVIVGWSSTPSTDSAWRWTPARGVDFLGTLPMLPGQSGNSYSRAAAVSSDGRTIVGQSNGQAFRWAGGGMVSLGQGLAEDISDNGIIAGGKALPLYGAGQAALWLPQGDQVYLGSLAGEGHFSRATGISDDGNTVVGLSATNQWPQAFRWTSTEGMVSLGRFAYETWGSALDVSHDGSRIVGYAEGAPITGYQTRLRATVWSPESGWQDLNGVLAASGVNLEGWELNEASGISHDGRFVVGYGKHLGNYYEGFWAELPTTIPKVADPFATPEPSVGCILLFGLGLYSFRRPRKTR